MAVEIFLGCTGPIRYDTLIQFEIRDGFVNKIRG